MNKQNHERRRYFRVNDTLDLSFRVVQIGELVESGTSLRSRSAQWLKLENDVHIALEKVRQQSSEIAEVLALFNQKINMLESDMEVGSSHDFTNQPSASVNISACGIAFKVVEPVFVGSPLQLHLRLYPTMVELTIGATVIACENLESEATEGGEAQSEESESESSFLIRADFTHLQEEAQEVLIQHVLRCQTKELKRRREARNRQQS
ncbi:hypothetical protein BTA51_18365 [Hahella sp. CCB-MM4]|uniref:hypothetical protein n=1 Tax=Hahella sp. (strain CCB-MM4) TaxID=1926491 RepID=UPI000B9AF4A7|nr:hypothetical protein [Hahella sp. CCB-MM4]OZG71969.1 hypothetical protein BTA51_18365 [Hahella sp. CCB-MM4]